MSKQAEEHEGSLSYYLTCFFSLYFSFIRRNIGSRRRLGILFSIGLEGRVVREGEMVMTKDD